MKNIAGAFINAQKAFGPALKTSLNPHFKSKYADLSNVIEAVIDALNNNGIGLMQQCHESLTGVIVETVFIHESGETLSCGKLHVPAAKLDPQGYGSALTYARRYSLMAACGIAPEDDDGNAGTKGVQANRAEQREHWLADQHAAIDTAHTSGALKRIVGEALKIAMQEKDDDAIQQITVWGESKMAKAKKTPKPDAMGEPPYIAHGVDLQELTA